MDDQELVARARVGDLDAANTLLARYQDVAYTVALRLLGQPSDAEDLAQEALERAFTRLSELHQGASFSGWLRRITVNLSLNALRRRGLLQFESLDLDQRREARSLRERNSEPQSSPEVIVLASALRAEVDGVLKQLPTEQRVAVVLRDMYDYDVSEIAEMQQCGLSAAKMRIMRGRAALRLLLTNVRVANDGKVD